MLEWLIIGGGIHGTHLSFQLVGRGGVPAHHVRVLDPHPAPLARWHQFTTAVGMEYLRSPIVHNLHWDQGALGLFSRIHEGAPDVHFIPPFGRPSLPLFNRHSQHLIDKFGLDQLRIQGWARGLSKVSDGWRVETDYGDLKARRVVLALGLSEQPHTPDWAKALPSGAPIQHTFSHGFDRAAQTGSVAVVGGGITAAQTALALAEQNPTPVALIRRHAERIHDFDADTGWMNAIHLRGFAQISDWAERRRVIKQARHRGSVPPEVAEGVRAAAQVGALELVLSGIDSAESDGKAVTLCLSDGQKRTFDHVVLATGFDQHRPGGAFLTEAIERHGLPTAPDGYPIVSPSLAWADGLYVSGPLAELEVGPASRNILGARMAGNRIYDAL
jgi:cation diffusion facilitator CzcD-associated flavoprotein CzcO